MPAPAVAARPDAGTRIPAEFVGKARGWRDRLTVPATRWATGSAVLLAPFAGPNRSPFSRRHLLAELPRRWHALPDFGRLDLWGERGDPTRIREVRAVPHSVGMVGWTDGELSVALALRRVAVALKPRPSVTDRSVIGAVISLHAIARYLARCCPVPTDETLARDLLALVDTARWRSTDRGTDVDVDGGVWRGHAAHLDNVPTLAIRTFVTEALMALTDLLARFIDRADESEGMALANAIRRLAADCAAVIDAYSAGEVPALVQRAGVALIWIAAEQRDLENRVNRRGRMRAVLDLLDLAEAIHRFHSGHGSDDHLIAMRAEISAALKPLVDADD